MLAPTVFGYKNRTETDKRWASNARPYFLAQKFFAYRFVQSGKESVVTFFPYSLKVFCLLFFQKSRLELNGIKIIIEAAFFHKRLVIALFDNVAVLHHEDDVRLAYGGQSVSHDKGSSALRCGGESVLNFQLGARIYGRGRLVENEQIRLYQQNARYA